MQEFRRRSSTGELPLSGETLGMSDVEKMADPAEYYTVRLGEQEEQLYQDAGRILLGGELPTRLQTSEVSLAEGLPPADALQFLDEPSAEEFRWTRRPRESLYKSVPCTVKAGEELLPAEVIVVGEVNDTETAKNLHRSLRDFHDDQNAPYHVKAARFAQLRRDIEQAVTAYHFHAAVETKDGSVWRESYVNVRPMQDKPSLKPREVTEDSRSLMERLCNPVFPKQEKERPGLARRLLDRGAPTEEQRMNIYYQSVLLRTNSPAKAAAAIRQLQAKAAEAKQSTRVSLRAFGGLVGTWMEPAVPHPRVQLADHLAKRFTANEAAHGRQYATEVSSQVAKDLLDYEVARTAWFRSLLEQVAG